MVGKLGEMAKEEKAQGRDGPNHPAGWRSGHNGAPRPSPAGLPGLRRGTGTAGGQGFEAYKVAYLQHLTLRNLSPLTIGQNEQAIRFFVNYLSANGILSVHRVSRETLEQYKAHLRAYKGRRGQLLRLGTIRSRLQIIQLWFHYLKRKGLIQGEPIADVKLPYAERTLPRGVMNFEEIKKIMAQPDLRTAIGYRDRTIMEVLYSTGVRAAELVGLRVQDIDLKKQVALVKHGKGGKQRFTILSTPSVRFLSRYLEAVRPELFRGVRLSGNNWLKKFQTGGELLFLSAYGGPISKGWLTITMKQYIRQAGITKSVSPVHSFRHSVATALMESGMDVRYVQSFLGHNSINSTQIYTHVERKSLQKDLKKAHPRELPLSTFQPFVEAEP